MAGLHDPPLSPQGKREASGTAKHLETVNLQAAYSSPLRRARETAEIVLGNRTLQVNLDPDIRELDMGEFSGRTWIDVVNSFPSIVRSPNISFWQLFARDQIPDQEPYKAAAGRVVNFFQRLASQHCNQAVLVVGHKGVLEVFLSETIGFDPSIDWFEISGGSVTTFQVSPDQKTKFLSINVCPGCGMH
jgi:broad specificity phosphatase PhoE